MKKTFYFFTKERPCCRSLQDVSNLYDAIEIRLLFLLWSVSPVPCSPDRRMVARSDYRGRQKRNCQGIDRAYHPQLCSHYCHDHSCILRREFVVNLGLLNNDDSNRHLLFSIAAHGEESSHVYLHCSGCDQHGVLYIHARSDIPGPRKIRWIQSIPYFLLQVFREFSVCSHILTTFVVCVDLVLLMVSVPVSIVCLRNFNHGLINHSTYMRI